MSTTPGKWTKALQREVRVLRRRVAELELRLGLVAMPAPGDNVVTLDQVRRRARPSRMQAEAAGAAR